jgi:hypothetical protein
LKRAVIPLALLAPGCAALIGIGELPDPPPDVDAEAPDGPLADAAVECSAPCITGPQIETLTPASAYRGSADTTVTVAGTGFTTSSRVEGLGGPFSTTYHSATELLVVLPSSVLAKQGPLALVVNNADGHVSPPASFVVSGCDPTGVDVPLGAATSIVTRPTDLASATLSAHSPPIADGPFGFAPRRCPLPNLSPIVTAYRGFIVQNTTDAPLRLSAWTVCTTNKGTGYLAMYRRPTVPASDTDLLACEGRSAAGFGGAGYGGFGAPGPDNPQGSFYCPGLTVQNGATLPIAACERIAVVVEEYDDLGTWPPPGQIRFRVDSP